MSARQAEDHAMPRTKETSGHRFRIRVDPHTLHLIRKENRKRRFTFGCIRCNTLAVQMNKRSPAKAYISAWIPRPLKRKLEKLAAQRGETISELVVWLLGRATDNVELSSKDYEEIAQEVRRAEQGGGQRVRGSRPEGPSV